MTYLPQRGIKLMNHHIQLMISCKGYNSIIASKCTRFCQTGHCMEIGEKNEVFIMKKIQMQTCFGIFLVPNNEEQGCTSKKFISFVSLGFSCLNSTDYYSEGHQSFIKDVFTYYFNKYLLNASYKPKSIRLEM